MTRGIYIYGIVPNFYGTAQFQSLENSGVYTISFDNISAIVSDSETAELDYSDRESLGYLLVQHQKTIESLTGKGFNLIIPMQLGTIVSSKNKVIRILSNGHKLIMDTFQKIEHLTEIDLAVTWENFTAVLTEIANHPDIMELKKEILQKPEALSQLDQVKVGMLIQEQLEQKNKAIELQLLDELSAFGVDIRIHEVMNGEMISNAAFLVSVNKFEKFVQAVEQLDEKYNNTLKFKIVGPLPCYSFYTLEVKDLDPEKVVRAGKELGLKEEFTVPEIKKAYQENARLSHPDTRALNGSDDQFKQINEAYQIMLEYAASVNQASKEDTLFLTGNKVAENAILVKIKD